MLENLDDLVLAAALRELTASPLPPLFPLGEGPEPVPSDEIYFEHYGLDFPGVSHTFGRLESRGRRLAGHVFLPDEPRGTVVVLHGYLDHVGVHSRLIRFLLGTGHAVAAYDMPGHGLSSGRRASTSIRAAVPRRSVNRRARRTLPGHSTRPPTPVISLTRATRPSPTRSR